jgi:hypothetical protein
MAKNSVITVEPGAHLIVNSSKITNDCDQCFWQGIQAWGQSGVVQNAANQGWVTIKNGSTISGARIAVSNYNPVDSVYGAGGIIQATNSTFINNHNSAYFVSYHNWDGGSGAVYPNLSYFTNCDFTLNNDYKGNNMSYPMLNHVCMNGVEGIVFSGCRFTNTDQLTGFGGTGEGIHALNTGFNVGIYCPGPSTSTGGCLSPFRSRFSGFTNGISIQNAMGTDPTVSIDGADFDTVSVGVNVSVQKHVSVTGCNFTVGNGNGVNNIRNYSGTFACLQNIGILTQNAY